MLPAHPRQPTCPRWLTAGRERKQSYTDKMPFTWGISPLRSSKNPHSGRNDIINQTNTDVISSGVEKSPATEMPPAHPRQPTSRTRCHFERSREIPRGRNGNNRKRIPAYLPAVAHRRATQKTPRRNRQCDAVRSAKYARFHASVTSRSSAGGGDFLTRI